MPNKIRSLPRNTQARVLMAVGFPFGCAYGIFGAFIVSEEPVQGEAGKLIVFVTQEIFLAVAAVSFLGFLWGIATPAWVEKLFQSACKKMFLVCFVAAISLVAFLLIPIGL